MAGHTKRNAPYDATTNTGNKYDATAPAIPEAVLAAFFAALTGAITTETSTTVSAVRPVSTLRYSTAINPFDTKSMDLTLRYGRGQWYKATEKTGGRKEIALVTVNADIFTDLLGYRTIQLGLDPIMNVFALGTGAVNVSPMNIAEEYIWLANLADPINILLQPHILSLKQVQAFSGWFMGDENSTLATSTNMIIK